MWLEALLQAFMDVSQSEQTSGTIRIVCTILVSLVFVVAISGLFLLVFVIEGQSILRRIAFFAGAWHPCLLSAIFEDGHRQKKRGKEAVIRPDIESPLRPRRWSRTGTGIWNTVSASISFWGPVRRTMPIRSGM